MRANVKCFGNAARTVHEITREAGSQGMLVVTLARFTCYNQRVELSATDGATVLRVDKLFRDPETAKFCKVVSAAAFEAVMGDSDGVSFNPRRGEPSLVCVCLCPIRSQIAAGQCRSPSSTSRCWTSPWTTRR